MNSDNNSNMMLNGELHLIQQVLPSATVIFDIGTNIGEWTKQALKINPTARYHCFEPSHSTYEVLKQNVFDNNVILNNIGLGNVNAIMPLFIFEVNDQVSSLYNRKMLKYKTQENVYIQTLDTYCKSNDVKQIDFIKVDVEGHEFAVLQGAKEFIREGSIKMLQFEYGGTYLDACTTLKNVWEYVKDINSQYQFFKIYPDRIQHMLYYDQTFETFQYCNWVIKL